MLNDSDRTPSITKSAFDCPYCGAFTTQYWYKLYADECKDGRKVPPQPRDDFVDVVSADKKVPQEVKNKLISWFNNYQTRMIFIEKNNDGNYLYNEIGNLNISRCYNCKRISVWVHNQLVYPEIKCHVQPNSDMPDNIRIDYDEARSILNYSPRGAAALLRLCIQKLLMHLSVNEKSIDAGIASLVSKGLSPVVQKALDAVRVIGNEAVHPGVIDISDDRDTALNLFEIVNIIIEKMISHPLAVDKMFDKIPESKKAAIEQRDKKSKIGS